MHKIQAISPTEFTTRIENESQNKVDKIVSYINNWLNDQVEVNHYGEYIGEIFTNEKFSFSNCLDAAKVFEAAGWYEVDIDFSSILKDRLRFTLKSK